MRVKFKQAVRLPAGPKGKDYSRGTHEVPDEILKDKFFLRLVKAGLVEDGDPERSEKPVSVEDRQQKLLEKLSNLPSKKLAAAKAAESDSAKAAAVPSEKVSQPEGSKGGDETPAEPQAGGSKADSKKESHKDSKHKK